VIAAAKAGMKARLYILAFAALAGACSRAPESRPVIEPDRVPVAAQLVSTGALRAVVQASGLVVPAEGAEFLLIAPEPARLVEVMKAVGDPVTSGEPLVRFELAGATSDLARQHADLAAAQARVERARAGLDRARDLVDRGLIPRVERDAAERELADAQDGFQRASTGLRNAEAAVGRSVVRAPFTGVVAARLHNPGDVVQPAATDPLLRIVDPARVEILATFERVDAARVLQGATARIPHPQDGSSIPLTVAARPAIPTSAGMVQVRLVPSAPVPIAVDTPVAVEIDAEERTNVVFVQPEWVVRRRDESVVMVAVGDTASRRIVTTGITTEAGVEITSGLKPGDLVITQGHVGLEDGAPISVVVR
jgi:cobalt-zinc-cadmium efflux system membrane fusion protein